MEEERCGVSRSDNSRSCSSGIAAAEAMEPERELESTPVTSPEGVGSAEILQINFKSPD